MPSASRPTGDGPPRSRSTIARRVGSPRTSRARGFISMDGKYHLTDRTVKAPRTRFRQRAAQVSDEPGRPGDRSGQPGGPATHPWTHPPRPDHVPNGATRGADPLAVAAPPAATYATGMAPDLVHAGHRVPLVPGRTLFDAADELELVVPASC